MRGSGPRLRPITHTSAKQLVPVANKPVLFYGLEAIAVDGVTQTGIVVADTKREIREAVGEGSRFCLDVTYLPQEAPLGLARAVLISQDFLASSPRAVWRWSASICSVPLYTRPYAPSGRPRRGELEIADALQWLIEAGRYVRSTTISGYWKATGNVTDMLEVNRSVLETVEPRIDGSAVGASEIISRVRIEDGAKVFGSRAVGIVIADS